MMMVLHQDEPVNRDAILVEGLPKERQKPLAIVIVAEDRLPVVAAVNDMEAETLSELPKLSCHDWPLQQDPISAANDRIPGDFGLRAAESAL
jgi:hypothetical protein